MVLKKEITLQIKDLLKEKPQGLNITDIVKVININRNTAGRYLENLLVSGQVEMRRFGMAKIYMISQRVPLSAVLSISSELVMQLDSSLRIIFANEPFLKLVGADNKILLGKNIEYTPVALIFDESITGFIEKIREGITGKEWSGEIALSTQDIILFCRIAPTVFDDGRKGVSVILEDITKRKQAERALLESEVKLRSITDNSPDMILLLNPKLEIVFINRPITLDPSKVRGKLVFDFIPQEFQDAAGACFEHVLKTGEVTIYGTEHHFANGKTLYFESTVGPVFQDGTVVALVINARDITERKQAEKVLQESEDRYRKLVDISPDAVIIHQEGKIIFTNPATLKLLGASNRDEIAGRNILDFVYPGFRETVRINIQKDLQNDITPLIELPMHRIDGTSIIVEGRGVKTFIDGKPAVQVAIRDITERKHAEEALRESEGKLNAMLQSIADPMSMMDKDLTIMWANEPAKRYFGKNIIGKKCYEVYHLRPDPCEPYPCLTLKAFLDGKTHQHDTTVIDNQGEKRFLECTANVALRDNSGKPVAVLETSRDITNRKKAEEALRESEEKYRTLIDRANDGICIVQDSIVKMCNRYLAVLWGGSVEQILGKDMTEFIHPDALLEIVNRYNRRMAGEPTPSIYETVLKRKDGSRFYAELNAGIISYEGKPADLIIIRDMNDRIKAQNALRENEATARALMNAPTDSVILMDTQGIILALNETAAIRFGKRSDELVGILADDLLPKEVARSRRTLVAQVLEKKKMVHFEDERDGRWYDTVAYPVVSDTGEVKKIAIITRDITDRRTIEEALVHSEQRFRNLITAIGDIVWETDAQARFVYVSPQVKTILGYSPDELIGHTPFEFLHPDAIGPNQKKFQTAVERHEKSVLYVSHWIHKDGHGVLLESNAIPMYDSNGSFSGFIGIDRQQ
jgi:PAS domain S-box-containing protein